MATGRRIYVSLPLGIIALGAVHLTSLYTYLLFHSIVEIFGIVVACGIFMVAWNSRRFLDNNYLLFIGVAYLFVAALDLVHTLSYKGMNVFEGYGTNLPTQLWVAARYVESLSLVLAPLFLGRRLKANWLFLCYSVVVSFLLVAIFYWKIFPICFVEGAGLTPFKKTSEYIISLILLGSIALLFSKRREFDQDVLRLLTASIAITIASEMAFSYYVHAYGLSNLIGHLLKVISFYLIYRAIIQTGLMRPYDLLFRNLAQSKEALTRHYGELEKRVEERTAALSRAVQELKREISERKHAEEALAESEQKYSKLVEGALTGVYIEQDGKIQFANQKFAEIYGYSRDEIAGIENWKLVHPDDKHKVQEIRKKRLRGKGAPWEYVARGLTKEGNTIQVMRRNTLMKYRGRTAVLGNITDVTIQKQLEAALQETEKELRLLSSQRLSAEENERKRIAQDLHDSIGQSLSAIKFRVEGAMNLIDRGIVEGTASSLEAVMSLAQETLEEVRRIVMDLRPSTLDDLGILPTIAWFCREFQATYNGIRIEQKISIQENEVSESLKTVIYRVLQEALNNIAKHSQADLVRFSFSRTDRTIEMEIEDNGQGFNLERRVSKE
ncbi:MAG: PAS domain S-box protein, partial [Desulfobacteraceae bacterium]|nr:PAS domain S-box protein [Desulfobacteraceae bacterium]